MAKKKRKPIQTENCCVCSETGEVGSEVVPVKLKTLFPNKFTKTWVHHGECHKSLVVTEMEKADD